MVLEIIRKPLNSTFLWLVVLLCAINAAWGSLRPLKAVPHTAQPPAELTKAAMIYKMSRLKDAEVSPDFVILGSSLPMCAFFYAECPPYFDLTEGKRIRQAELNLLQAYPYSGYFTHKSSDAFGKHQNVFNFTGAACMVSDAKVILEQCISANRAPKTLILGLGLRDFVDNINPPPGETPIYNALCDLSYLINNVSEVWTLPAFSGLLMSAVCKPYQLRNECKLAVESFLCSSLHRSSGIEIAFKIAAIDQQLLNEKRLLAQVPSNLQNQQKELKQTEPMKVQSKKVLPSKPQKAEKAQGVENRAVPELSVLDYKQRYCPANLRRFDFEMTSLRSLIALCRKKKIHLVLVNMPVSSEHWRLSPPELRTRYLAELRKVSTGADMYLNYEKSSLFEDKDFFDTVHLNADGARKFIDELTSQLVCNKQISADARGAL